VICLGGLNRLFLDDLQVSVITQAMLTIKLAIAPAVLAEGLSHSVEVAERHYATAESVLSAKQSAIRAVLTGGTGSSLKGGKTIQ